MKQKTNKQQREELAAEMDALIRRCNELGKAINSTPAEMDALIRRCNEFADAIPRAPLLFSARAKLNE